LIATTFVEEDPLAIGVAGCAGVSCGLTRGAGTLALDAVIVDQNSALLATAGSWSGSWSCNSKLLKVAQRVFIREAIVRVFRSSGAFRTALVAHAIKDESSPIRAVARHAVIGFVKARAARDGAWFANVINRDVTLWTVRNTLSSPQLLPGVTRGTLCGGGSTRLASPLARSA
jgi:hypothetical protein